ncbi:MAG: TolC family protein [Pseudomonadota bacterium]|nr:TolC family protein [Pseudomonadota bacterium]
MKTLWVRRCLVLTGLLATIPAAAETLQQAWAVALEVDHSLKSVRENSAAAEQQLKATKAARVPGVSLDAGYTALDNAPAIRTSVGGALVEFPIADQESLSYNAMANLPLYTSGRISHGIDAANASLQASRKQESSKTLDLKLKVSEAFVSVLRATRAVKVSNSRVTSLKAHARDVANMHDQGMVSRNDLLASQVALADAQQDEIKGQNALDIAKSAYNRLLGRPLNYAVSLDDPQPELFNEPLETLTERALKQRHELLALHDQISAIRYLAAGIRAETGPQVALRGGYGFQENQYQVYEGKWSVNLGVQWNLFDGGVVKHQASAKEREAAALQEQYDDLVSNISLLVRQHWLDVQESQKRIQVTEKATYQAEENLKVNRDRYENGLSTNTDVLNAETLRTGSQNNHANAIYDAVLSTLRLKRSVGEL